MKDGYYWVLPHSRAEWAVIKLKDGLVDFGRGTGFPFTTYEKMFPQLKWEGPIEPPTSSTPEDG